VGDPQLFAGSYALLSIDDLENFSIQNNPYGLGLLVKTNESTEILYGFFRVAKAKIWMDSINSKIVYPLFLS